MPLIDSKSGPRCPNHNEPLELDLSDRSKTKGVSACPISKCMFEWSQQVERSDQEVTYDKFGNVLVTPKFSVYGDEESVT